jgi:hypothetical protein
MTGSAAEIPREETMRPIAASIMNDTKLMAIIARS